MYWKILYGFRSTFSFQTQLLGTHKSNILVNCVGQSWDMITVKVNQRDIMTDEEQSVGGRRMGKKGRLIVGNKQYRDEDAIKRGQQGIKLMRWKAYQKETNKKSECLCSSRVKNNTQELKKCLILIIYWHYQCFSLKETSSYASTEPISRLSKSWPI